jgi:tetratricopeptide (TPR) repeat protein
VSRKARKFKSQNNRLLLPGYEVIYMWTGFDIIPLSHMNTVLSEISNHLTDLDSKLENFQKTGKNADLIPYETFNDDIALARFLKGIAIRELNYPTSNTIIPANELVSIKPTTTQISQLTLSSKQLSFITAVADQIVFDHWILPYSRFELGQIYMRLGNYKLARKEFKAAKNGGYTDKETGILRKRYSMENSLHLKTHNCLVKLTVLEKLAGLTVEDSEDEEIVEESD